MIDLDPKAWRTLAAKFKIKDNGLEKALVTYEKLAVDAHDECLKTSGTVSQLAGTLKRAKEVTAVPHVVKYLGDLIGAAEDERNEVIKLKAAAAKAVAEKAKAAAAAEKSREGEKEDGEPEDETADYKTKLLTAFQKVKGSKDQVFEYIICDAKPFCGLMIAKKIAAQHKQELTKITDGGKRFHPGGTVEFRDGHFIFNAETPVAGLARRLQDSIKNFTGKKLPIMMGLEKAGGEEGVPGTTETILGATREAAAASSAAAAPKPSPELTKGTQAWVSTCNTLVADVKALGKAIDAQCADQPEAFTKEVNGNLAKLEARITKIGRGLAESLAKANQAPDVASRNAELARSRAFMAEVVKEIKPLAALIQSNPFVASSFTNNLTTGLTIVGQAITQAQKAAAA